MAGDLDFSIEFRVLNEKFNRGIDQARDRFSQFTRNVERNLDQMGADTERARTMLSDLGNVSSDRLTAEIRATADQLRQMGAGANITREQLDSAMSTAALQVTRLGRELDVARQEALRLGQTNASPTELTEAANRVNRLEQELGQARSASTSLSNELAGAMNRASTSTDNARNALYRMANIRVPETIRAEIDQINRALIDFTNNSGRPAAEIERATRAAQAEIRRLENELNGLDETQDRVSEGSSGLGGNINRLRGAFGSLQGLMAAAGLGIGVAEIIEVSDAFINLEAKIKLATGEGANFVNGFNGVKQIANETFSSVENTGELFARITQASEALGLAQKDVLGITKTINQAIQLSGGSAASADAAITQLLQGLSSGQLRGEEFNSIMEQSPRLAQAMADGLGVTRGELRAMAADGKLTSEVVINAVRSQGEAIASEFTTLPETVGNAVQTMKNSLFVFIGGMNESVNQSGRLAEAINYISDALDNIDPATMATIEKTFDSILETAGVLFTTIKDLYTALSDIRGAFGVFVKGGEQVGFLTSVMQSLNFSLGVVSDGLKGISILADSMFGTILILAGGVVSTIEKMKGQNSDLSDELFRQATELHNRADAKVMEFESSTRGAWAEMSKTAKDRLNETLADTEKTYDEMVAKGGYSAEAMEEQFIKVALAKIAANDQMINDDLRLALAAKDLQVTISETGEVAIESSKGVQAAYKGVGQSFAEVALKAQESGTSMRESLTDAVPKAQTIGAVDDIISSLSALSSQGKISGEDLAYGINLANERYKEIEENFARYAAQSIKDNDGIVTSELEKAAALQGLAVQATETGGVLVTQLDRSTLASERTKEQIDELAGAFGVGLSKEFIKSSEELDMLVDGFDDLENAGYDAGGALVGALTEMSDKAKNEVEIEALTARWHELYKEGKITGQELADGLEQVENRANMLKEGINSVTEAYGFLGLKTREELAKDAKAYTDSYNMVMEKGELTAQQQEQVFTKMAKANIAANGGVIDSFTAAQAAAQGFTVEVDKNGRVIVEKMDGAAKAVSAVKPPVDGAAKAMRGLGDEADDAGKRMVKAASKAYKEFDKLKKSLDDQGRVLNTKGEVMKVATYTQESAFESLLQRLGLSESSLTNSERNKLRSQASRMAKADGHLRDPYKYGLTNAMQADQMADEFVESWERRMEKEKWHKDIASRRDDTSSGDSDYGDNQNNSNRPSASDIREEEKRRAEMYYKYRQAEFEQEKANGLSGQALEEQRLLVQSAADALRNAGGYVPQAQLPQSAIDAVANLSKAPNLGASKGGGPVKTIKLDLSFNGKEVSTEMPENQEGALMALLQQLQESKALSGH